MTDADALSPAAAGSDAGGFAGASGAGRRGGAPRRRRPGRPWPWGRPWGRRGGRLGRRGLRPARFDDLGLKRALSDRLLPSLVGAMAFLAALAVSGAVAAAALARHWQAGAGAALTVQVPDPARPAAPAGGDTASKAGVGTARDKPGDAPPGGAPGSASGGARGGEAAKTRAGEAGDGGRLAAVLAALRGTPGVAGARALEAAELEGLLRPWLGGGGDRLALPLPAVIEVRLADRAAPAGLAERLEAVAPGTLVEGHEAWMARLGALARSVQACAGLATAVVAGVSAAVVAAAVRAGLAARRDAIEVVHGLGATDAYIAGRFARRVTALAATGAALGAAAALPVLLGLARLAEPFTAMGRPEAAPGAMASPGDTFEAALGAASSLAALPGPVWAALPLLPPAAAAIGWVTAQGTVRRWLRRLP